MTDPPLRSLGKLGASEAPAAVKSRTSPSRRPRPASYHQELSSSSTSSGSPKSSGATRKSPLKSPQRGCEATASLALKIPPRVDRTFRRSGSPGARSSASGSSNGSSDSLPSRKATAILAKLARMREEKKLLDIALIFYGGEIQCHRIILAASSPYFRDMLGVRSHLTKHESIEMRGVDMVVVRALVDYAYTSTLTIGNDRIKTMLEAANMFQFQGVIDACVNQMKRSRRHTRQRSVSGQRTENGRGGRSPSSWGSPRSGSPRSTPVQSPRSSSPVTSSPLLFSPKDPVNGSSKTPDAKARDVYKILQDSPQGGRIVDSLQELKSNGLQTGPDGAQRRYTRSHSTGSEGYRSSAGSDSSFDISSQFVWTDSRHPARAVREMVRLRQDARIIDVVLRTKIKDFPCHRVLLEASSNYLSRVISRDIDGTSVMDVHLKKVSADVLQKLIQYMYTGRIAVSERDAGQVYKIAKRFGLDEVCLACVTTDPSLEAARPDDSALTDSFLSTATNSGSVEDLLNPKVCDQSVSLNTTI
ncbi:uncharacterized protein LOC117298962 [Asterias rubens]|uniref:uncharacterized protein LOC117298962 n=1 Tax=Asterias rubens TaxID=7604 RepID=UPI001455B016|nr:uncharacterized protein LOC117298962 [Asterias rubens]XP_033638245.1 uncharacterized protein LOC117298962 [Asterias rubens]XP_033638246.1 uncharacterized protein LOC117298962 [Asterias rubens]